MIHGQLHIRNAYTRIGTILSIKDNRVVTMFINLFKQGLLVINIPHNPFVAIEIHRDGRPIWISFSLHELIIGFVDISIAAHDGLPRNVVRFLPFGDRFCTESTVNKAHIVHDATGAAIAFKKSPLIFVYIAIENICFLRLYHINPILRMMCIQPTL